MAEPARKLTDSAATPEPRHGLKSVQGGAKHKGTGAGKLSAVPPPETPTAAAGPGASNERPLKAMDGGGEGNGQPAGQLKSVPEPEGSPSASPQSPESAPDVPTASTATSASSAAPAPLATSGHRSAASTSDSASKSSSATNSSSAGKSSTGFGSRAKSFSNKFKSRKNKLFLAVSVVLALFSMAAFFLAIPFKLIHIGQVLLGPNAANNQHTNNRIQTKLMQRLFLDASTADGSKKIRTGRPLHDFFTNHRIANMDKILNKNGTILHFDDVSGKLINIQTPEGKITDFRDQGLWEGRRTVGDLVKTNLDTRNVIKRVLYTKAMRAKARVSFKFWALDKGKTLASQLVSKVLRGTLGDGIVAGADPGPTSPNPDPKSQAFKDWQAARQAVAEAQAANLGAATDATIAEATKFNEKFDKVAARKAAIAKFRASAAGKALGWSGYVTIFCMIRQMIESALIHDAHYADRVEGNIREGNLIITQIHEMETGHVPDLGVFDQYMQKFDGDPTASPTDTTDTLSFDKSAAWKRNTGEPVDSQPFIGQGTNKVPNPNYNPDLPSAANPNPVAMSVLLSNVETLFNLPGEATVCKILTGFVGWLIGGVEVVLAIADGESSTAAAMLASTALITYATSHILPAITDRANNLAITGVDNAVDSTNIRDAGLNLSEKELGRLMGDRQGTDAENATLAAAAQADDIQLAKSKGWTYRAFAIDNNHSVFSQLVGMMPSSPAGAVAAITTHISAFSNLPNTLSSLANLFFHPAVALAGPPALDPYGFRASVTTDTEVDDSDPMDYEDLLYDPIPLPGQTVPQNADGSPLTPAQLNGVAYQKADGTAQRRIDMLGDPNTYSPDDNAGGDDASSTDLMHCFVNKFRDPSPGPTHVDDPICLGLGYITKVAPNGVNPITTDIPTNNPGQNEIINLIYCQANKVCGLPWTHQMTKHCTNDVTKSCGTVTVNEFDLYRLYLKYTMLGRGLACEMTSDDCFKGTGAAAGTTPTPGGGAIGNVPAGTLTWPTEVIGSGVSQCFVPGGHPGVDIFQAEGKDVYAVADGTVVFAGPETGYGPNFVAIKHPGISPLFYSSYGHMSAMIVKVGDVVKQKQKIGSIGNLGASFGAHVHLNIDSGIDGATKSYNGNVNPFANGLVVPPGVPNQANCS